MRTIVQVDRRTFLLLFSRFILYTLLFTSIRLLFDQATLCNNNNDDNIEGLNIKNHNFVGGKSQPTLTSDNNLERQQRSPGSSTRTRYIKNRAKFHQFKNPNVRRKSFTTSTKIGTRMKKTIWDHVTAVGQNLLVDKELYAQRSSLNWLSDMKLPPTSIWYHIFKQMIGARPEDYVYDLIWPGTSNKVKVGLGGGVAGAMVYSKLGLLDRFDGYKMPIELLNLHVPSPTVSPENGRQARKRWCSVSRRKSGSKQQQQQQCRLRELAGRGRRKQANGKMTQ